MLTRRLGGRSGRPPLAFVAMFVVLLTLQIGMHTWRRPPLPHVEPLPEAPPAFVLRGLAFGDPELLAGLSSLYLQTFDNQPGASIPFRDLDYVRLTAWLERALSLDPRSHYPLMMAAQVYAQVPDAGRQRLMLDFVHRAFMADPELRWRWLAHGVIVARHRLHDARLALRYATDIATYARHAPGWARQMQIFLLQDLGEAEQAKLLLGALLATGEITDPGEIRFLTKRLHDMGAPTNSGSGGASQEP